jgi:DNA sulfur modification protein DndB
MKIPAIRANIGIWCYYISALSFSDIANYVKKVDNELHNSATLSEMIQRSITDNYIRIKEYLLTQEERFFNALVLAVYDGDPKWVEVELNYKTEEFFNLGFLEFTGDEKIFPVDGQHRVEGIKDAIKEKPDLALEKVPVIFIGHKKDEEGMQRSRRLFSTLNRYAKPVSPRDIIALDEDDAAAIVTRALVENFELFTGDRVVYVAGKPIPETNKSAFTSIVTLYQCNSELLKYFLTLKTIKKNVEEYKRFRPSDTEISEFENFCFSFWESFTKKIKVISEYLRITNDTQASTFRNKETGGNILFRPIGLLPFIFATIELCKRKKIDFNSTLERLNKINLNLNKAPWKQVLWNDYDKTMLRGDNPLVSKLLMYQVDKTVLTDKELYNLKLGYAAKRGIPMESIDEALEEL